MISKKTFLVLMLSAGITTGFAQKKQTSKTSPKTNTAATGNTKPVELKNANDSASYAIGMFIAKNIKAMGMDTVNIPALVEALTKTMKSEPIKVTEQQAQQIVGNYQQQMQKKKADENLKKSNEFLAKNKLRPEVITTASGLQYEVIKQGPDGPKPGPASMVKAHYHGTLLNGFIFDSSVNRGTPLLVSIKPGTRNSVIPAWMEALQLMTVGTKIKLYCPPALAYGVNGSPPNIGPNEVLVFEMELVSIEQQ